MVIPVLPFPNVLPFTAADSEFVVFITVRLAMSLVSQRKERAARCTRIAAPTAVWITSVDIVIVANR